ncbi:hypothetical protein J2Z44_002334 [Clostridium punense]|uniref:Uncharacterized protein n=1 Tax=Clostridium punense TaxID=1054297 RepID=A0ABS4K3Z9_9CLOT|nr:MULTISPECIES: hypothetical protein [Clostridium]EQB86595.1 hypothetical protein M918_13395 [Clostridium sp. BL8]MBP2022513.1 hypothetical protein [Clostridium punense]
MRRITAFLLCIMLIVISIPKNALATGDGNFDGGGGGMGNGTSQNFWNPGNDGVRVTVIRNSDKMPVTTPIDLSNNNQPSNIGHFGKKSKIQYVNGATLSPKMNGYVYYKPSQPMPRIIGSSSYSINIEATKKYFCSEYAIRLIADITGMKYDNLINGDYKLLIEPIAYMTFQGVYIAMTAHEAALYDEKLGGGLRSKMVSLSHKNLPLALFLQTSDLGFPAWTGANNQKVSNAQIKAYLGLGVIRFGEADKGVVIDTNYYEYRCDTDVISSITVSTQKRRTPDSPVSVTFRVNGQNYTVNNIYIPEDESQKVWFKWHTPLTPQTLNIDVSVSGASAGRASITAKIVDLKENTPPNPTAYDKNNNFKIPSIPSKAQKTSAIWGEWDCYWEPKWEWEADWSWVSNGSGGGHWVDNGHWVDRGDWKYRWISYNANLSANINVQPDSKVPTALLKTIKSGYGVNVNVSTNLSSNAPSSAITGAQNVISYYPEFNYQNYNRILEKMSAGYSASFKLKSNKYSTYNQRVHFTPIWYPDGTYNVYSQVIDTWTPDGMLSINLNDYVNIKGSLYDDWHIAPKN